MGILKRAFKCLKVKKMKTLLLILIFFVIGNLIVIMYGINQTAKDTKKMIRMQMQPIIEYYVDYFSYIDLLKNRYGDDYLLYDEADSSEKIITLDEVYPLIKDTRVKAINSSQFYEEVSAMNITPIVKSENYNKQTGELLQDQTFRLIGNGYDDLIEFHTGDYEIVEGRFYTENEIQNFSTVGLISKELAIENQLKIGDIIIFYKEDYRKTGGDSGNQINFIKENNDYAVWLELEIIGIYKDYSENKISNSESFPVAYNSENQILLPLTTLKEYSINTLNEYWKKIYENENFFENEEEYLNSVISFDPQEIIDESKIGRFYLLNDPSLVDSYLENYEYLNTDTKFLYANNEQYKKLSTPLKILEVISELSLIVVVFVSILFISLITILTFKMREYEFGLQIALGIGRLKVIMQLFMEFLIVSFIGLSFALISGKLILNKVDQLIRDGMMSDDNQNEIQSNLEEYSTIKVTYFNNIDSKEFFKEYGIKITAKFIIVIYIINSLIVLTSIFIPASLLVRYSPKKILMNRE